MRPDTHAPAACPVPVQSGTPGITDDEIAVGAVRFRNAPALFPDAPEREFHEYAEAMLAHVNSNGGVACRRVRVVWHDLDLAEYGTASPAATEQAMCATWTQDHQVFAAIPAGDNSPFDVLYPCLDRAGVAIIDIRGVVMRDAEDFAAVPRLIAVNAVRLDRGAEAQVNALVRRGFLTPDSRIGIVHYDDPAFIRTVDNAIVPALAAHGLELTDRRAVALPTRAFDNPDRERDVANAALQFKLAGIDRVLFVRGRGLAGDFMRAAERNHYRPAYGLTTDEVEVVDALVPVPPAQLVGARGIGWIPDLDLSPRRPDLWPTRKGCLDFYQARGFATATRIERIVATVTCEAFWFFDAAVDAAPRPLSADAMVAGAAALGDSYESPFVRWTRLSPDYRDGAAMYRDTAYDPDCGCFVYTSGPRALP